MCPADIPKWYSHYVLYHDQEWGVPSRDPRYLFESICLEGAQAGLSWWTVLKKKRERYRQVFHDFQPEKVAAMTDVELENTPASVAESKQAPVDKGGFHAPRRKSGAPGVIRS